MRGVPIAVALLTCACSHALRDPELLASEDRLTFVGTDFTRSSIHDPLFDPGTFTAERVQTWSDMITAAVRAALPGAVIATDRCDRANAAFVPHATLFDPRPWRPEKLDEAAVRARVEPWLGTGTGLGVLVSLERVNAEDRLSALVIVFDMAAGRVALAERVRSGLVATDPFAATNDESSLLASEYRPHFEALGRAAATLVAAELGG